MGGDGPALYRGRRRSVAPPKGLLPDQVRGREVLVAALAALVDVPDGRVHVLHGLGGCGKTTVALTVAEQARARGARVYWMTPRDETSLCLGLVDLAVELGATMDEITHVGSGERSVTD